MPYREIIQKILKEEAGHQGLGERIVVEMSRSLRFPKPEGIALELLAGLDFSRDGVDETKAQGVAASV